MNMSAPPSPDDFHRILGDSRSDGLTSEDLARFAQLRIPVELLRLAHVERVTDRQAREKYGIVGPASSDMSGIAFPYFSLETGFRVTARVRRDNPKIENGKEKGKYVSPFGDRRHFFFPPGARYRLESDATIVLVEAEKSALSITAFVERAGINLLAIAMGGCWGWRGRKGRAENARGERVDETGPIPDLAFCSKRNVIIMLDSNADTNSLVSAARYELARELRYLGAKVRIASIPALDGINGPDDFIGIRGDQAMRDLLELSRPDAQLALAEAEAVIATVAAAKPNASAEQMRRALDAVADVPDPIQRVMMENLLTAAVRGVLPKSILVREVKERIQDRQAREESLSRKHREAELRAVPLQPTCLIKELESFFADRAHMPRGAALVLAYFALNTWTFKLFDTVPYLLLESAVPGCGKSTVIRLLDAISCGSRKASSLSEAVMFRLIDAEAPTLLVDEAETVEGRSERAEGLRAIAHEGYKQGGQVPRCDGEAHQVRWFDVYCPKVFAAIGGLTGALLDRCLVIHMEKAPKGSVRKSTRHRALQQDGRRFVVQLEAYALQASDALRRLYEAEPDCGYWPSITDREAELWGPLLIHARLAGPDAEAELLAVVHKFSEEKAEIKSADSKIAQALALLEAVSKHPETTFTPGQLVPSLAQSEAWGRTLAEAKGRNDDSVRVAQAAKVGFFLRSFRLHGKKNTAGHMAYERQAAIACLSAHVPQNPPNSPQTPSLNSREIRVAGNNGSPEGTETTEGFGLQPAEEDKAKHDPSGGQELGFYNSASRAILAVLPTDEDASATHDAMVEGEI